LSAAAMTLVAASIALCTFSGTAEKQKNKALRRRH